MEHKSVNKLNSSEPTQKPHTRARGAAKEDLVCTHLMAKGWRLVEKNFLWRGGEIDLVMRDPAEVLVFLEVRSASKSSPWLKYSIGPAKSRRLIRTAQRYFLCRPGLKRVACRFDLVWVEEDQVEHWKNVVLLWNMK